MVNISINRSTAPLAPGVEGADEKKIAVDFKVSPRLSFQAEVSVPPQLVADKKANLNGQQSGILDKVLNALKDDSGKTEAKDPTLDQDKKGAQFKMTIGGFGEVSVHYKASDSLVKAAKVAVTALDVFQAGQSLLAKTEKLANRFFGNAPTHLSSARLGLGLNSTKYAKTSAELAQPRFDPTARAPEAFGSGMTATQLAQAQANVNVGEASAPKAAEPEKKSGIDYQGKTPEAAKAKAKPQSSFTRAESDAREAREDAEMKAAELALVSTAGNRATA